MACGGRCVPASIEPGACPRLDNVRPHFSKNLLTSKTLTSK
jgi:hypothetical protein